jgi:hypothetical protein
VRRSPSPARSAAIVAELRCQRRSNPRPASLRCGLKRSCPAVDKNRAPKEMLMASISGIGPRCFRRSEGVLISQGLAAWIIATSAECLRRL